MIHSLGIHFGVPEWQQDFMKKFEFVQSHDEEQEEAVDTVKNEVETKKLEKSPHQVEKVFAIIEFVKLMKMTEILWTYNRLNNCVAPGEWPLTKDYLTCEFYRFVF